MGVKYNINLSEHTGRACPLNSYVIFLEPLGDDYEHGYHSISNISEAVSYQD